MTEARQAEIIERGKKAYMQQERFLKDVLESKRPRYHDFRKLEQEAWNVYLALAKLIGHNWYSKHQEANG